MKKVVKKQKGTKDESNALPPDFIIIPYQVFSNPKMAPVDKFVYGIVYYFANMGSRKCFASNETIADLIKSTPKAVSNSLLALEKEKYVKRFYYDDNKTSRKEIVPMVSFGHLKKINTSNFQYNLLIDKHPSNNGPSEGGPSGGGQGPSGGGQGPSGGGQGPSGGGQAKKTKSVKKPTFEAKPSPSNDEQVHPQVDILEDINIKSQSDDITLATPAPSAPVSSDGAMVNTAISLFEPYFLGDFTKNVKGESTGAYARQATRDAVHNLLQKYSLPQILGLLQKWDEGKSDPFRPQVGTVYEFCTYKLAKIEAFVNKSAGNLYAQRSISTPEQRATSDAQIDEVLEQGREKIRKAKEEWDKTHSEQ